MGASTVKAKPTEPQKGCPQEGHGYVVGQEGLAAVILPGPQGQGSHRGGYARVDVDHRAASEVKRPHLAQEAAPPDPVGNRGVHEKAPEGHEKEKGGKPHPFHHGP